MTFGDFLYFVGFQVEYTAVRLARRVWAAAQWAAWAALTLLAVLLRPVVQAAANFKAAQPRQHHVHDDQGIVLAQRGLQALVAVVV